MKATINQTGESIHAESLASLRNVLIRRMVQDDKRAYTAITTRGTIVHVSLYDGEDYIQRSNERKGKE